MADNFPMTKRIEALLAEGKEDEARALAQAQSDKWMAQARSGQMMNLSDLLAQREAFVIHGLNKRRKGGAK